MEASEGYAAQVVMLALGRMHGVSIRELQELMRQQVASSDTEALAIIGSASRFNLSDAKLEELLPYLKPALIQLVTDRKIVFDDLTRPFYYLLNPSALPHDAVPYLSTDLIRRQWNLNNAYTRFMPDCQGLWRVFRISTPERNDHLEDAFFKSDCEVNRGLLVIKHAEQLKREKSVPEFSFYHRRSRADSGERPKRINGHLMPVGNRVYLMGQSSATFGASYVSTIVWALDEELHDGARDALGLLTNSNSEQIAAPFLSP